MYYVNSPWNKIYTMEHIHTPQYTVPWILSPQQPFYAEQSVSSVGVPSVVECLQAALPPQTADATSRQFTWSSSDSCAGGAAGGLLTIAARNDIPSCAVWLT